jgi:hypothetical protein
LAGKRAVSLLVNKSAWSFIKGVLSNVSAGRLALVGGESLA